MAFHFSKPLLLIMYDLETNHDCLCLGLFCVDSFNQECPFTSIILVRISPFSPLLVHHNCTNTHTHSSSNPTGRKVHVFLLTCSYLYPTDSHSGEIPHGKWLWLWMVNACVPCDLTSLVWGYSCCTNTQLPTAGSRHALFLCFYPVYIQEENSNILIEVVCLQHKLSMMYHDQLSTFKTDLHWNN